MEQEVTILLTGRNGFIGKNLYEYLNKNICCNVLSPEHEELDLTDQVAVERYFDSHLVDIVIHSANVNMNHTTGFDILNHNLRMFFNLERCHEKYRKMFYFGSGAEYDKSQNISLVNEEDFDYSIPQDSYGFTKYIMAKNAEKSENIFGLVLFGVYGKYEDWKRRFISNNLCRCIKGLPMTLSQNAMFDYLYIDDLCRIMEWFITHDPKHKRYNVCSGVGVDLLSIVKEINQVTGLNQNIQIAAEGRKLEYTGCNDRLLKEMGEFLFVERKKAIGDMWKYYRKVKHQIEL